MVMIMVIMIDEFHMKSFISVMSICSDLDSPLGAGGRFVRRPRVSPGPPSGCALCSAPCSGDLQCFCY